jgi:hypothetical protein
VATVKRHGRDKFPSWFNVRLIGSTIGRVIDWLRSRIASSN